LCDFTSALLLQRATGSMPKQLLGIVSAWYPEQKRGHIKRSVRKAPTRKRSITLHVEHWAFDATDVKPPKSCTALKEGDKVLFGIGGQSSRALWCAAQVRVLTDSQAASAKDGAPGYTAEALCPSKIKGKSNAAGASTEAASSSNSQVPIEVKKFKKFQQKSLEDRNTMIVGMCELLQEEATDEKLRKRIAKTLAWIAPPQIDPPEGAVSEDNTPHQRRLRKALASALENLARIKNEFRETLQSPLQHVSRIIDEYEDQSGLDISEAGKFWGKFKERINEAKLLMLESGEWDACKPQNGAVSQERVKKLVIKVMRAIGGRGTLEDATQHLDANPDLMAQIPNKVDHKVFEQAIADVCVASGKKRKKKQDSSIEPATVWQLPD